MRYIPENNLAYPVLIKMDKNGCGSGFFLKSKESLYLVTAKHVFLKQTDGSFLCDKEFSVTAYSQDPSVKDPIVLSIQLDSVKSDIKKHPTSDIVVVKIGTLTLNKMTAREEITFPVGVAASFPKGGSIVWVDEKLFKKYDDVFLSNDIFILGYPVSIGQKGYEQIDITKPLLRKGIVAGKNEKKRNIILDCPVYFGNSGGLVLQVDIVNGQTFFLPIGVVSEYVPFVEELFSLQHKEIVTINRSNSGYSVAVPIDTILDLI